MTGPVTNEVLAERLANAIDGITDIRNQMVVKDIYVGGQEALTRMIGSEREDRVRGQAESEARLNEKIIALRGDVVANKAEADATADKVASRRSTLQTGIIVTLIGAVGAGVVGVLVAVLNAAAHLT